MVSSTATTFRRLHQSGCFVIPNPWDIGSARLLVQLGFPALATTSSGFAWSMGRQDNHVSLSQALAHFEAIAGSVDVPVNGDFEGGFAVEPREVADNVRLAAETGVAGLSIEDSTGDPSQPLFDFDLAVERVRAASEAIAESKTGIVLTGRSEGFIVGRPDLKETIRRLTAYAKAGADCLYAPGIRTREEIVAVVQAVAPKPVNVLVGGDFATVSQLAGMGVRRISVGGALARAGWTGFLDAAREIAERGTFSGLARARTNDEINGLFADQKVALDAG
jgi:2-methylisocitrate lyase-like PEP mutase family enzyme